jgi:hypothetical protein
MIERKCFIIPLLEHRPQDKFSVLVLVANTEAVELPSSHFLASQCLAVVFTMHNFRHFDDSGCL